MPGLNITYILGPQGVRVGYAYIFLPGGKFKTFQISSSASSKYSGYHWGLDGLQFHFMNYTYIFEKLNWPYKKGTFFLMPLHKVFQFLTKSLIWDKLWNDSKSFLCTNPKFGTLHNSLPMRYFTKNCHLKIREVYEVKLRVVQSSMFITLYMRVSFG